MDKLREKIEESHRPYTLRRRLHDQGGSLLITLPKIWTEAKGLKAGDDVLLQFDGFQGLLVVPAIEPAKHGAKP
jgi:antitoxin component of MazEF toxin-antitoxin module